MEAKWVNVSKCTDVSELWILFILKDLHWGGFVSYYVFFFPLGSVLKSYVHA